MTCLNLWPSLYISAVSISQKHHNVLDQIQSMSCNTIDPPPAPSKNIFFISPSTSILTDYIASNHAVKLWKALAPPDRLPSICFIIRMWFESFLLAVLLNNFNAELPCRSIIGIISVHASMPACYSIITLHITSLLYLVLTRMPPTPTFAH